MVPIPSPRTSSNLNWIELTSLALESLKRVWEVSGGSLDEVSEGEGSPGGFRKVLDSKSDTILNEKKKSQKL